jgi:hypothetical protein
MDEGRYDIGCKALAESLRLDPRSGTLFTLAVCESRWGRIATAMARFDEYLRLYERLAPEQKAHQGERPKAAREERDKLAAEVPKLMLLLPPGAPEGTIVKRNGEVVGEAALGIALPVDPGEHVLSAQAPGGPVWKNRISIGKGEMQQVTLEVKPAPVTSQTQPPPNANAMTAEASPRDGGKGPSGRRIAAYAVDGVGLAALVMGGVSGGLALAKKGVTEEHCGSGIGSTDKTACNKTGLEAAQSMESLGIVSTVGFVVGLAGVGTATVLLLTEPKHANPSAGVGARWIRAGVLSVGPQGALLGLGGVW